MLRDMWLLSVKVGTTLSLPRDSWKLTARRCSSDPQVSYNDPYFPFIGKGRKYELQMKCTPVEDVENYDCVLIVTDHSDYDYQWIAQHACLVVDTRNATKGIDGDNIVRC